MIIKLITVHVKHGHMDAYLAAQDVWNKETQHAAGNLGILSGSAPNEPDTVYVQCFWRSRTDLDHWMKTDHDRIAAIAKADEHYDRIDVKIIEADPSMLPQPFLPGVAATTDAGEVQVWSELYRTSAALRIATRLKLFDDLADGAATTEQLAQRLHTDAKPLNKLLIVLEAMRLLIRTSDGWQNTPTAERTLVTTAPGYQGRAVLHNTQPEYIERVFGFGRRLGLTEDTPRPDQFHPRFIAAMNDTAQGGQADALVAAVDLSGCKTLLDIGGATGLYSAALCRSYPDLTATVLDQEQTLPLAEPVLKALGMEDRVQVIAHDYRNGPFSGPVDVVLISDILRGETPEMVDDILHRVHDCLHPGGRLLITDLFTGDARPDLRLRAGLFGLHMGDAVDYGLTEMAEAVRSAGFEQTRSQYFDQCVVMNGLVEARRVLNSIDLAS